MRKLLIVIIAFFSLTVVAQAQVHPRLIGDKDVFKMEDEAKERWEKALPRLAKNPADYNEAWARMNRHVDNARLKWSVLVPSTPDEVKSREMWTWCYNAPALLPDRSDKDKAERFARLEVRAQLCDETEVPSAKSAKK